MSQASVVSRLAVHELWISFRLLLLVAAFVAVGAVVALLPAPLPMLMQRLAVGIGVAGVLAGAMAAWAFAEERASGRAGWLVGRSVGRGTLVVGWFVAVGGSALAAAIVAGALGWLAASAAAVRLDSGTFALGFAAAVAPVLTVVALGILLGTLLPPAQATLLTVLVATASGIAAWLVPGSADLVPGAGLVHLATSAEAGVAVGPVMRAAGVALLAAAVLVGLARAAMARVEL